MIKYTDFKQSFIDSYQLSSEKEVVTKHLAIIENNMFITPKEVANSLCVLHWNMSVPYETILKIIKYFWSSKLYKATKIFEEKRKNYDK